MSVSSEKLSISSELKVPPLWTEERSHSARQSTKSAITPRSFAIDSTLRLLSRELRDTKERFLACLDEQIQQQESIIRRLESIENRLYSIEQRSAESENGQLLWRIPDFHRCLEESKNSKDAYLSRSLYTGKHGYKIKLLLYPNGISSGLASHVSFYVSIQSSEHDYLLPWPFEQEIDVLLVDSVCASNRLKNNDIYEKIVPAEKKESACFKQPDAGETNPYWGFPRFVKHDVINRYTGEQDALCLLVNIKAFDAVDHGLRERLRMRASATHL